MARRTREVSGIFTDEEAAALEKALLAGQEDQLDRLLLESAKNPPDGVDQPVPQASKRRWVCGDCSCNSGRSVKTCYDQRLLEQPDGEWRWVTVGVKLESCSWVYDVACWTLQFVRGVVKR